ncbi:hypothetical protein, partial [Kamptonema sp. PCC 6506]|uniref:hypothetical protein n=1 Tax=Kamptonema sp. PCC 6506 TaxID=272129 RepID=UPI0005878DB9
MLGQARRVSALNLDKEKASPKGVASKKNKYTFILTSMSSDFSQIPQTPLLTEGLNAKTVTSYDTKYPSQVQPYFSETLVKSVGFAVRPHWLQGSIKCSSQVWFNEFAPAICCLPGDKVVFLNKPTKIGMLFENHGFSPGGIRLAFNQDGDQVHGHFTIYGSYLDAFSSTEAFSFIWMLSNFGAKFTRIDLVFIDFEKRLLPHTVANWCDAGLLRGPRQYEFKPGVVRYEKKGLISYGSTLCLGSRESGKFVRMYEAAYLHDSDSIRWEIEF